MGLFGLPSRASAQLAPVPAGTEGYWVRDGHLVVATGGMLRVLEVGCRVIQFGVVSPTTVYVACDGGDVLTLGTTEGQTPRLVARQSLGENVDQFFVQGDHVWAQVTRVAARLVGGVQGPLPPSAGGAAAGVAPPALLMPVRTPMASTSMSTTEVPPLRVETPPPRPRRPPRQGHVTRTPLNGDVTVDLGADDGLSLDDNIEIYRDTQVDEGVGPRHVRIRLAVARVVDLSGSTARVHLGLDEGVPVGALAERTLAVSTASRIAPPRANGLWEVGLAVRPFVTVGNFDFGVLGEGWVTYRFELPLYLTAGFAPGGVAANIRSSALGSDTETWGLFSGRIEGGYDGRFIGIGVGIGGATYVTNGSTEGGFALFQSLRIGAVDGLSATVENVVAVVDTQFQFAGTRITAQIPVANGVWVVGRGAGSVSYGFGEFGARFLARGNGRAGSLFLTPTVGVGGATEPSNGTTVGPLVGLLAEGRF